MDLGIFAILAQDGITSGAIYALLGLALVLVFSVTRVIFIPQGEFVAYGALTLAALQSGKFPLSAWLLVVLGVLTFAAEGIAVLRNAEQRRRAFRTLPVLAAKYLAFPLAVAFACRLLDAQSLPMLLQIALAFAVVVPMGPMLYRLAYQPLANATVLVLLIVSVGVHLAMVGLGLVMFGAEGARTLAFTDAQFQVGTLTVSGQSLVVVAMALLMIVALYLYFDRSLSGKALRATAVNRLGARLVGIGTNQAGKLAFTLSAAMGVLCGILIAPMTAMYYESGFIIALKGFVGAIFGGLAVYPLAAAGSLLVGLLESYASFWASSFKEVIVFTVIIPVLLWRSLTTRHADHEE
jgi:branched-chain amino acid transport system permease protein